MSVRDLMKSRNPLSHIMHMPRRLAIALSYADRPILTIPTWLLKSRETTNFTYDLTPRNLEYLAATVSQVSGCSLAKAQGFIREPLEDAELQQYISDVMKSSNSSGTSDAPRFARRLGWYAFARATKPSLIVETGIDKGLGAVLLCTALRRNAQEGQPGQYRGTDINPRAGYLLGDKFADIGKILYGDSIESLRKLSGPIDLFINDSDHSADYEFNEYQTIESKLSERAIILADNAHCSDSLFRFARETGRGFLFFAEQPFEHWYPGAGIGISFPGMKAPTNQA